MADGYIEFTVESFRTPEGVNQLNRMMKTIYDNLSGDTLTVRDFTGYGSPEGVITAGVGSTYRQIDGGASTTFYVKESGTGNTGWQPK